METSNPTTAGPEQAEDDVVSAADNPAHRIAEKLGASVKASKVFGEPVQRGDVTVIPVARAKWGFGGGGGRDKRDKPGSGGGGGASMSPIGYIEIHADGTTRFCPTFAISDIAMLAGLGLLAALVAARIAASR
jgi:uncharacterized spore protein YtfJ